MRLTMRQTQIITYLMNNSGFITSEQLSQKFSINRKNIISDIRSISEIMLNECKITSHKHYGYQLQFISEKGREILNNTISFYGGLPNCMTASPASLIIYLLFLHNYISMQELGDNFFRSKTTIAREMKTVERWLSYRSKIELEISHRGIRIVADELDKRICFSIISSQEAFETLPVHQEIKIKYKSILTECDEILRNILIQENECITGESLEKLKYFLSGSILRSQLGFHLGTIESSHEIKSIAKKIAYDLHKKTSHMLDEMEIKSLSLMLETCDMFSNSGFLHSSLFETLEPSLKNFELEICKLLHIPSQPLFHNREEIIQHLLATKSRIANNDVIINHYNEQIIRAYPLASHIVQRLSHTCFDLPYSKTNSFLCLFLQSVLNDFQPSLKILLVSDQNIAVVEHIESTLRCNATFRIGNFTSIPGYVLESNLNICQQYDLLLATQSNTLLINPSFHYIPPIFTFYDAEELNGFVKEMQNELRSNYLNYIRTTCVNFFEKDEAKMRAHQLLSQSNNEFSYDDFSSEYLHVMQLSSNVSPSINIYRLDKPLKFRHKAIQCIIHSCYNPTDHKLFYFDRAVSELLFEKNIKSNFKDANAGAN